MTAQQRRYKNAPLREVAACPRPPIKTEPGTAGGFSSRPDQRNNTAKLERRPLEPASAMATWRGGSANFAPQRHRPTKLR